MIDCICRLGEMDAPFLPLEEGGQDSLEEIAPSAPVRQILFENCLLISSATQSLVIIFLYFTEDAFSGGSKNKLLFAFCAILESVLTPVMVFATYHMLKVLRTIVPKDLFKMFLANTLYFAGVHLVTYGLSDEKSFLIPSEPGDAELKVYEACIAMLYFSVSVMTSTGWVFPRLDPLHCHPLTLACLSASQPIFRYGDISPQTWFPQLVTMIQMVVALSYNLGVFSISLGFFHDNFRPSQPSNPVVAVLYDGVQWCFDHIPGLNRLRSWLIRHVLLVSTLVQVFTVVVLVAAEGQGELLTGGVDSGIAVLCIIAQLIQFVLILDTAIRLVAKVRKPSK